LDIGIVPHPSAQGCAQDVVTYVTHSWGGAAKFAALAQKAREDRLSALK